MVREEEQEFFEVHELLTKFVLSETREKFHMLFTLLELERIKVLSLPYNVKINKEEINGLKYEIERYKKAIVRIRKIYSYRDLKKCRRYLWEGVDHNFFPREERKFTRQQIRGALVLLCRKYDYDFNLVESIFKIVYQFKLKWEVKVHKEYMKEDLRRRKKRRYVRFGRTLSDTRAGKAKEIIRTVKLNMWMEMSCFLIIPTNRLIWPTDFTIYNRVSWPSGSTNYAYKAYKR